MTTHLFVIDPQLDFCDGPAKGALAVSGAWQDMQRLAGYVDREGAAIDEAFISLDSHHAYDIGHAAYWRGPEGEAPAPFSLISATDVSSGRWIPTDPARLQQTSDYLEALEAKGRYRHTVWPTHCLVGTPGHAVQPDLMVALTRWSSARKRALKLVLKGLNSTTEHYSAIQAEIPDPLDPATAPNLGLVDSIRRADRILVAGEALSHCVMSTLVDLIAFSESVFDDNIIPRLEILVDAMSPVAAIPNGPDFPAMGLAYLDALASKGARLSRIAA